MTGFPLETRKDRRAPAASRLAARSSVIFLGLRGIPNVQGGVEKHVELLAGELAARGWAVEVLGRSRYLPHADPITWNGVRVSPVWAPRRMALEALVHTFLGIWIAAWRRPDIVHIHAVGPALLVPLARLLGLRVVVTHHGYDYQREKWGGLARRMLKLGEAMGMRLSHGRIAISNEVASTMATRYAKPVTFIPNGVAVSNDGSGDGILAEFGLEARRYILLAARFVPEKRQIDLIRAFAQCRPGFKLVLAGGAEFETPYSREVRDLAATVPGVVLTGFRTGPELAALFANAALFVLPSSHEGMPIALLEAMAFGLPVLASDIGPNRELGLPEDQYFPLGDIAGLTASIDRRLSSPFCEEAARTGAEQVIARYSWSGIAGRTQEVYRAGGGGGSGT